jgi:hypothetical protein
VQPKKEKKSDKYKESTKGEVVDDGPLDDPELEKARQQRWAASEHAPLLTVQPLRSPSGCLAVSQTPVHCDLLTRRACRMVEESDYSATRELFGDVPTKSLEDILPKTLKDFEEFGELLCSKYLLPHGSSKNYKALLKTVVRLALGPLTSQETKDVESTVAGVRVEKSKAEQAAKKGAGRPCAARLELLVLVFVVAGQGAWPCRPLQTHHIGLGVCCVLKVATGQKP